MKTENMIGIDDKLVQFEPLIYYHIHKMKLWHQFPSYRDDMLQEGRMAVVKALNEYADKPNVVAYIHSTVRNSIYDFVFKEMKLDKYAKNINYKEGQSSEEDYNMELTVLIDLMKKDKNYDMLYDYFIEGQPQSDVATNHDVSQQWVSQIVNTFRDTVREAYFGTNL